MQSKLETHILKLEQEQSKRNEEYFRFNRIARKKILERDQLISDLKHKVASSINFSQMELLHQTNANLSHLLDEERQKAFQHQQQAQNLQLEIDRLNVELQSSRDLLAIADLDLDVLHSIPIDSLDSASYFKKDDKDGGGGGGEDEYSVGSSKYNKNKASKKDQNVHNSVQTQLILMNNQVKQHKLNELKLSHQVRVLESTNDFIKKTSAQNEAVIGNLQQRIVESEGELKRKEVEYKQRNAELLSRELGFLVLLNFNILK